MSQVNELLDTSLCQRPKYMRDNLLILSAHISAYLGKDLISPYIRIAFRVFQASSLSTWLRGKGGNEKSVEL